MEPEKVFYKPEMRTVVNVEKPAPVVVDVLMKPHVTIMSLGSAC